MISIFIIIILIILCLLLIFNIMIQKNNLKDLNKQIKYIYENETNKRITVSGSCKEIKQIALSINKLIDKEQNGNIKLRRMQKSMKNTLTSISHDLRTPLTSMNGYIQMLQKDNISNEKRDEYINVVKGRIKVVQNIVEQLFEFIRLENDELILEREKISVDDILRDTLAIYYYDFLNKGKEAEPKIIIPDKTINIIGDKNALKRVFSNIIYNSLIHGEKDYKIELKDEKDFIEISFSNYTNSIEKKDVEMVFERFFTSDKSKTRQTTGLGLCISKMLVEKMEGSISASLENNIFRIKIKFDIYNKK
ncbi:sensor histidine kinase KdpD [uncultured Clostridium sp.]|uniref:sensor histidine kinase n=1 Tax=uncultured Clostridium sp. TaxID=59620 RepID=UPI002589EFD3|nr:HAMP domain-containing sensor histidine kinase [uncultured Clostridium sp.]